MEALFNSIGNCSHRSFDGFGCDSQDFCDSLARRLVLVVAGADFESFWLLNPEFKDNSCGARILKLSVCVQTYRR